MIPFDRSEAAALGKKLSQFRKRERITQGAMAERLGITASYLCDIERGFRRPSEEFLVPIALHYRIDIDELREAWLRPQPGLVKLLCCGKERASKIAILLHLVSGLTIEQFDLVLAHAKEIAIAGPKP